MKANNKFPLAFGFLVLLGHTAFAQQPIFLSTQPIVSSVQSVTIFGNLSQTEVSGAPFSAIEESMYSQGQSDGTYQDRTLDTTRIYRDSQGRTRAEHRVTSYISGIADKSWLRSIYIADPVAGFLYRLDPENHHATRSPWNDNAQGFSGHASITGPIASTKELQSRVVTESLGTATIEGLTVAGTRQTLTVPMGIDGNERPFSIVLETWTSPELEVVVLAKYQKSRSRNTTRLTKIDRSEPAPTLFQVPSGYTIEDAPTVGSTGVAAGTTP